VLRQTADGVSIITAPAFNFSFAAIPRPVAGKSFEKKNPKKKDHESKYESHNKSVVKDRRWRFNNNSTHFRPLSNFLSQPSLVPWRESPLTKQNQKKIVF